MEPDTDRYKSLHELTPTQLSALELVDAGRTHAQAAEGAGVDRTTVSRWATRHPAFVAELNRRKRERADDSSRQVAEVTANALSLVGSAIQDGDVSVAMQWLKQFGLDAIVSIGHSPATSDGVIEQWRIALTPLNDPLEMLHKMDGKTTTRVLEETSAALSDSA